jgi:ATP-binding cassette subfamily C protein
VDTLRSAWHKSYPGLISVGVFSVVINILRLATPLYILQILDRVIASRSLETLFMLSVITLIAIVCGVLLEVVRRRMLMHWGYWIERSFAPALFAAGLKKGNEQDLASSKILRDVGTVSSFVSGQGLIAWLDIIWAPIFIGCVFLISPALASIVLIGSLVALALGTGNELITRDSRNATLKAGRDDRELLASAERNRESIGSLGMVHNITRHWSRSAFARLDESKRTRTINVYFTAAMRLVGHFVRIGIYGVGIWLVIDQVLTIGSVIAASILGRTAYSLVQNAMLRWRRMVTAKRAYRQMKVSLLKDTTKRVSRSSISEPLPLVLEKVAYRYPGQPKSVIRNIQLTVQPGEFLCVLGPSASGKTTFSRLISGLIAPRSGKIRLGDIDVYRLQQDSTHRDIGYLPQEISLFQGTVRENIAGMADGDINLVVEAAKLAGIHQVILNLPAGYDTEIVDKEPLMSAGQRKCIAVARAFYGTPPLIIMDEPIPHLDYPTRKTLMTSLMQLKSKGSIIILTTQRKLLAKNADMILSFSPKKGFTLQTRKEGDNSLNPAGKKVLKKVQENSSRTKKPKANVALVAVAQNSDLPEP